MATDTVGTAASPAAAMEGTIDEGRLRGRVYSEAEAAAKAALGPSQQESADLVEEAEDSPCTPKARTQGAVSAALTAMAGRAAAALVWAEPFSFSKGAP